MSKKERILVVGGGFAGVKTALELSESPQFAVTLLSDKPRYPGDIVTARVTESVGADLFARA